jgi:hypothetical protein
VAAGPDYPGRVLGLAGLPLRPFVLAGWWSTDDDQKQARLAYYIQWADHGALAVADRHLRELKIDE